MAGGGAREREGAPASGTGVLSDARIGACFTLQKAFRALIEGRENRYRAFPMQAIGRRGSRVFGRLYAVQGLPVSASGRDGPNSGCEIMAYTSQDQ